MCKLAWLRFRVVPPGVLRRSCAVDTVCADDADDDLWMITCGFSSLLPSGSVITVEEVYCISGRNVIYAKQLFMFFFFFVCLFPSRRRTMLTNSVVSHGSLLLFPGRWCWRYKDGRGGRRRRKYKPRLIASQSDSGNVIEWVGGWEQKPWPSWHAWKNIYLWGEWRINKEINVCMDGTIFVRYQRYNIINRVPHHQWKISFVGGKPHMPLFASYYWKLFGCDKGRRKPFLNWRRTF